MGIVMTQRMRIMGNHSTTAVYWLTGWLGGTKSELSEVKAECECLSIDYLLKRREKLRIIYWIQHHSHPPLKEYYL